jgi:LemA protein
MSAPVKILLWALAGLCLIAVFLAIILFIGVVPSIYNNLNAMNQSALGGASKYSAALNICSQKIKGVWAMADQISTKETEAQKAVATARSGFENAAELFKTAMAQGKGLGELTKAANGTLQSALAVRVQIEAYPVIRSVDTYNQAMRSLEEGTNEIKTALDDWIRLIQRFNTYRKSFWVGMFAGVFSGKFSAFPMEHDYYKGPIGELNIGDLNPQKK